MKRTIAIMLLLLALLTACGTSPVATVDAPPLPVDDSPRILTPLTPGLHDPYVLLEDGYASFGTYYPGYSGYCISGEGLGYGTDVTYGEVVDLLGYDLLASLPSDLPEHIRFTEEDMYPHSYRVTGESFGDGEFIAEKRLNQLYKGYQIGDMYGGYKIIKVGEPYIYTNEKVSRYRELALCIGRADRYFDHPGEGEFHIVGWEDTDRQTLWTYPTVTTRSRVGDVEVSFLFETTSASLWREYPDAGYYAGFTVDGIGYTLQSVYGYCTQEEFITLTLAVIDAAVAHTKSDAHLDAAADIEPTPDPLVHDPYIELEDGYAAFNEITDPASVMAQLDARGSYTVQTWRLGFDPIDSLAAQPERMVLDGDNQAGGARLRRDGEENLSYPKWGYDRGREPTVSPTWLELRLSGDELPKLPGAEMSYINGTEVLLLHADPAASMWPDQSLMRHSYFDLNGDGKWFWFAAPHNCYFAAFTRNGVSVALYAHNGYCTQEEFLNAVTALVDAGR